MLKPRVVLTALLCTATFACGTATTPDATPDAGSPPDAGTGVVDTSVTKINGTLGDLGAVKATVSSLMIANSGETLVYMSSAPITCDTLKVSRWLKSTPADAQIIEIVISGDPKVGSLDVPPEEINFAKGGRSSSYEVNADSGTLVFTKAEVKSLVEGTLSATYGSDSISGTFHATYCPNGQGY